MYRLAASAALLLALSVALTSGQECTAYGEQCKWKNALGQGKPCCPTADGEATACTQAVNANGNMGQFYCSLTRCLA